MKRFALLCACAAVLMFPLRTAAQSTTADAAQSTIPRLMYFNGQVLTPTGEAKTGPALLTFGFYVDQTGGPALWTEQHAISLDAAGRYSVVLGSLTQGGLPADVFVTGAGRWLGVAVDADAELPRFMMLSVAYALKAADADTFGGKAPADFVLNTTLTEKVQAAVKEEKLAAKGVNSSGLGTFALGTLNIVQKGDGAGGFTDSNGLYEINGNFGIGGTGYFGSPIPPGARLHIFTPGGSANAFVMGTQVNNEGAVVFKPNFTSGKLSIQGTNSQLTNVADLLINPEGGNLGIGTNNPQAKLHIATAGGSGNAFVMATNVNGGGAVAFKPNFVAGKLSIQGSNSQLTAVADLLINPEGGNLGVGTLNPQGRLHVVTAGGSGNGIVFGTAVNNEGALVFKPNFLSGRFALQAANSQLTGVTDLLINPEGGRLGIGQANPQAMLHVGGDVIVDGNIGAKYQDVAEWVSSPTPLEPGTIVIVNPRATNEVITTTTAYDSRIAGAVSAQPGLLLGQRGEGQVMVAQSGRVRIKVDARYGAIQAGDLLVTSPRKGYAMRSRPIKVGGHLMHRPGTVLGKALEALPSGEGDILALLTLQ